MTEDVDPDDDLAPDVELRAATASEDIELCEPRCAECGRVSRILLVIGPDDDETDPRFCPTCWLPAKED